MEVILEYELRLTIVFVDINDNWYVLLGTTLSPQFLAVSNGWRAVSSAAFESLLVEASS